ncbi:ankyrin repeat protein, putative [Trichomonas vaginalis G3]|uniref:Ankyrin repeat protein, putative n=1 Tax=Trichomonas vaginalis (strain ATCC PRA-98 / G3) TaxID=412133 RepID=A2F1Z1_TRIV3|nr:ankyrin repeat and SOCS box-containing protein 4 family [Trichomonas vaginalis G3]EAY01089.1 ankyrin repeat protein, putative [Trichomonas vaginalis G3]KAI5545910.1 ankyrin repeat and SOCS box-containing protein 4 family [Trichomonas vaginalis G3]|eukprot:XP_001330105.1 ankyrin repeat protein [Trichomonas vaginalis G3]
MSNQGTLPNKYSELRSIYKYYIDAYNALYQLKTENSEEINKIYKMIKTELIDSKSQLPNNIINDILRIIRYNNRYLKPYLSLAKLIYDNYQVNDKIDAPLINFEKIDSKNIDIHTENTVYRAIMYNDKERFICFIESEGFDKDQELVSNLYPYSKKGYSLLELCCYHGAVDCFKLLRTKFKSQITKKCLRLSFLGGNPEIMSECLKYQRPDKKCMKYAIISHNIDFVTFLMNEYNIEIDLEDCGIYNNLESFLVYFDQSNDFNQCFINSTRFNILSILEYFLSHDVNINAKDNDEKTALHVAAIINKKEIAEFLISHGANINEKNKNGETALHKAAFMNSKETVEFLISYGANINEKDNDGETTLHKAAFMNNKETIELLISHGANINENDKNGETALHKAAFMNNKESVELLISHGANINAKEKYGHTPLHLAALMNCKEIASFLISHGAKN